MNDRTRAKLVVNEKTYLGQYIIDLCSELLTIFSEWTTKDRKRETLRRTTKTGCCGETSLCITRIVMLLKCKLVKRTNI